MFKKIDKEILFGGIFGIIAIVATAGEMIANGISIATIFGAIKDIAGTLVAVMVFIIAVRHLFVKKVTDFNGVFEAEMEKIIAKYAPIISKDSAVAGRYNIASNLDSILGKEEGAYHTMFDANSKTSISFNISNRGGIGYKHNSAIIVLMDSSLCVGHSGQVSGGVVKHNQNLISYSRDCSPLMVLV